MKNLNVIPKMTDERGKYWEQPKREEILVDEKYALMTEETLDKLKEYSCSIPSGVYLGKMWKAKVKGGWYLSIYNRVVGDEMEIRNRVIILI